ncbi:MAG: DNA recombination protein RmuC [Peptostreptococcaceae bacterium]|nr:DNA recombination protein RmuC [Peptostreptococcaceae bacterium]
MEKIELILTAAAVIGIFLLLLKGENSMRHVKNDLDRMQTNLQNEFSNIRVETANSIKQAMDSQNRLLQGEALESEKRMENVRKLMESRLNAIQTDNSNKLEQMREMVDHRLQVTLESRIGDSFRIVNDRLEQVYKGLGEMQTLAVGVGDLKKILSNVKTRGMLGEYQLGAILSEILAPEQYEANVATKKNSQNFVEFAVKMPSDGKTVYLPIDAKFPADAYEKLMDAYEAGEHAEIRKYKMELATRIKGFAKDISEKYIDVPNTTEFAILFLPFEGLYAEVIRSQLFEEIQRKYRVTIAGPTTMAALLNSLQMGFQTLAIQKRSSEVWDILASVKAEFDTFEGVLNNTQKKLESVSSELDRLVGVRTRQIQRKLKDIHSGNSETSGKGQES